MTKTVVEVFSTSKDLKVMCKCGCTFWVSGNIPAKTVCDNCKNVIGLRLALKMLKHPTLYQG